jgi:light-regulated signal transduction histidine kinase (bacteriophytochrome)
VISAKDHGDAWLFAVRDNGIGIPKRFQTQIFGIFKRLHNKNEYPGTGIGSRFVRRSSNATADAFGSNRK